MGLSVTIEVGKQYSLHVRTRYYEKREHMTAIHWARYPQVAALPATCTWLTIQSDLGLASTTIEAYGRALQDYLTFCRTQQIVPETATRAHIAAYVSDLTARPHRRGSCTYALRIMFRGLAQSGCVACMSRRSALDRCFHDPLHPCWPASAHTSAALFTMITRCPFLDHLRLWPRRHPIKQHLSERPDVIG